MTQHLHLITSYENNFSATTCFFCLQRTVEGKERDETEESDVSKKSAVFCHLLSRPDCLGVYDDSHFSVLCRASYVKQLKVLEAVCIRVHNPVLCKQKKHVVALKLFS